MNILACQSGERRLGRSCRGFLLVELVAYCALFMIVVGLAYGAYYRCLDSSRRLRQNASDITLALNAGERWREDVRLARGFQAASNSLVLTQAAGCVEYAFDDGAVWRRDAERSARLLAHVKDSSMRRDAYQRVTALSWELELEVSRTNVSIKPLFTFKAPLALREP